MQRATRLELAAFSHENIALHRPSHLHRFRPDLTAYARVLPERQRSGGINGALHLAVDEQLVQEFDRAFDRNSSGEKSAGLSWHERAVGWPGTTDGSGRFVCGGSVPLREAKRLKGCTATIVPNHSAFRKRNDSRVTFSSSRNAVSFSSDRTINWWR